MTYEVILEATDTGFSAYAPDLPGCIATGPTREDVAREMQEAIAFHLNGLEQEGMPIPKPSNSNGI